MTRHVSIQWKRLRRSLAAGPGRWVGGSAVSDLLGLLAVDQDRLAAPRSPQHDAGPPAAAGQGTGPRPTRALPESIMAK